MSDCNACGGYGQTVTPYRAGDGHMAVQGAYDQIGVLCGQVLWYSVLANVAEEANGSSFSAQDPTAPIDSLRVEPFGNVTGGLRVHALFIQPTIFDATNGVPTESFLLDVADGNVQSAGNSVTPKLKGNTFGPSSQRVSGFSEYQCQAYRRCGVDPLNTFGIPAAMEGNPLEIPLNNRAGADSSPYYFILGVELMDAQMCAYWNKVCACYREGRPFPKPPKGVQPNIPQVMFEAPNGRGPQRPAVP